MHGDDCLHTSLVLALKSMSAPPIIIFTCANKLKLSK